MLRGPQGSASARRRAEWWGGQCASVRTLPRRPGCDAVTDTIALQRCLRGHECPSKGSEEFQIVNSIIPASCDHPLHQNRCADKTLATAGGSLLSCHHSPLASLPRCATICKPTWKASKGTSLDSIGSRQSSVRPLSMPLADIVWHQSSRQARHFGMPANSKKRRRFVEMTRATHHAGPRQYSKSPRRRNAVSHPLEALGSTLITTLHQTLPLGSGVGQERTLAMERVWTRRDDAPLRQNQVSSRKCWFDSRAGQQR